MENVNLKILEEDYKPALVFDNVHDLGLEILRVRDEKENKSVVMRHVASLKYECGRRGYKMGEKVCKTLFLKLPEIKCALHRPNSPF